MKTVAGRLGLGRPSTRERRLAEDAEARGIFDNAAAAVAEVDLITNRIVRSNRVFRELFGHAETDLARPLDLDTFAHPDDRAEQARQWAAIRETGGSFQGERRFLRADGAVMWGHVSVSVTAQSPEGRPTRLVSIIQDISERKEAQAALQASQDLLHLSLDIGGVGTFRRDYVAGLIYCTAETRAMTGLPAGDAPIRAEDWLATVLPDDRPRFLRDAADAHAERRRVVSFDYRFIHPDKGIRYAETRSRVDYDDAGRPTGSLGVVIDVTDRRRAESRLAHMAHHDSLTNLPNRSFFRIRLDDALEQARLGRPFAILCLDLDNFKDVNDTLGHPIGDALLRAVTARLQGACQSSDTVARLGGDEFAIIQSPLAGRAEATALAQRVIAVIGAPYEVEGNRITIGTSIGIAWAPEDGLDPDRLLRQADMALYAAKGAGRGCWRIFEPAMDARIQTRRALDADLRQALAEGGFELFYQPLVCVATHEVLGFEALLRWRHPTRGMVMPDTFIPVAEANGLIVRIGAFALARACAQAALWPGALGVAVNLSASEFSDPGLVDVVAGALRRSGLDPKRLELEITETTMLQDTRLTTEILHRLRGLGVRLSIDDFGTGFSSLGYLQRFRFDKVKIDRSFISPLGRSSESLAIVSAVTNLCAGLGMRTTAEGVETEEHLRIVTEIGCSEAQGYHFSRPRPADEIPGLIERLNGAARLRGPRRGDVEPSDGSRPQVSLAASLG